MKSWGPSEGHPCGWERPSQKREQVSPSCLLHGLGVAFASPFLTPRKEVVF